jgi:cell division protein FtsB
MFWKVFLITALGVLNAVLFYRMIWSPYGIIAYYELRGEHERLESRVQELNKANLALSREILLLRGDNDYVEKMIRRRLHYVKENEILYLFSDARASNRAGVVVDEGEN